MKEEVCRIQTQFPDLSCSNEHGQRDAFEMKVEAKELWKVLLVKKRN